MPDVLVARIGKPHGLRGEVTVQLHTDDPHARFAPGSVLDTEAVPDAHVPATLTVVGARVHQQAWLLSFDGVTDRTGAEALRGTRLLFDPTNSPEVAGADDGDGEEEEGWYADDLVGFAAVDVDGQTLGEVSGLLTGPQDLLQVRLPDGHEALVPFTHALVPVVDVAGRRVVLDPPQGLLDLGRDG